MMILGLRTRLLLAVVPPFVVLAALAVAGIPGWLVATLAVLAASSTVLAVVTLLAPFETMQTVAVESVRRAGLVPPDVRSPAFAGPTDGTGVVSAAVTTLLEELTAVRNSMTHRERQFKSTLGDATEVLAGLAHDWRQPVRAVRPDSPWSADNAAFAAAVAQVAGTSVASHQRVAALQAVLHDIPDPVMVLNARLATIFVNTAAEDWFAQLPGRALKQPLATFLAEPSAADLANVETAPPARVEETLAWVRTGRGGSLEITADTADGPIAAVLASVPAKARRAGHWTVLMVRDLTASKKIEANLRHLHRRQTGQRMSLLVAREGGPSLEIIRTQSGLLAQAAKKSGQRDQFLPKIQRILEEVDRQKLIIDQLAWIGRLTTTEVCTPDAQEVRLRTVAEDTVAKLAPAFAERGNSIDLTGDAGWLIADEERIATVVTGLLLHANTSSERTGVTVALGRRSEVATADDFGTIVVRYPGAALTAAHVADVRDPFGRPNSGVTDASGKTGFLLGLAVAHKVAGLMGGSLDLDGEDGVVTLRVALPTRARTENRTVARAAPASPAELGADAQDALGDFFVGGDLADTRSETDTPRPAAATAAAGPADLAGEDDLGSFFGPG
jgi:signal transduction histidine kinase